MPGRDQVTPLLDTVRANFSSRRSRLVRSSTMGMVALITLLQISTRLTAAEPQSRRQVIFLNPQYEVSPSISLLSREIVRQAFLLTAREDFNVAARDGFLREFDPLSKAPSHAYTLRMVVQDDKPAKVTLISQSDNNKILFAVEVPEPDEQSTQALVKKADQWSQGEFKKVFRDLKLPASRAASKPAADLPSELPNFEFMSYVIALQKLHHSLKESPKSAPLLAQISAHYAMLGSLTERHWGAEHKIFKARALLYAERGLRLKPQSAEIAWSKALALMLTGLHAESQKEVERARKLGTPASAPPWAKSLEAFASWNESELAKCVEREETLAIYFQFLATEMAGSETQLVTSVTEMMKRHSECYRVASVLAEGDTLGLRRSVGAAQLEQFLISFPVLLQQVNGLPDNIQKLAKAAETAEDQQSRFENASSLIKALKQVPSDDQHEPSLAALGTLAENLHFSQAVQMLQTERQFLALDTTESIGHYDVLLEDHPAREFLQAFHPDPTRARQALENVSEVIKGLPSGEASIPTLTALGSLNAQNYGFVLMIAYAQRDSVTPELLTLVNNEIPEDTRLHVIQNLTRLSPRCPTVIAEQIRHNWEKVAPLAKDLIESSANPKVLRSLADHYSRTSLVSPEEIPIAERCWNKCIQIDPSFSNYEGFSRYYFRNGNFKRYEEVLMESLELPNFGLDAPRINETLANYHMSHGDWAAALPFAMRAADSYSAWGLNCGARCLEGLGQMDKAEQLVRAKSERYDNQWNSWYLWCQRTGRGDLDNARKHSLNAIRRMSPEFLSQQVELPIFWELEEDHDAAIIAWRSLSPDDGTDLRALHLGLLLHQTGQVAQSRQVFKTAACAPVIGVPTLLLEPWTRTPDNPGKNYSPAVLNFAETFVPSQSGATNASYFIGRLFLHCDRIEEAKTHLQSVASNPEADEIQRTMAAFHLRAVGGEVGEITVGKPNPESQRSLDWLIDLEYRMDGQDPQLVRNYIKGMLANAPDWTAGLFHAGRFYAITGDLDSARETYSKFLEKDPDQPWILCMRAKIHEKQKNFAAAIADYEHALKVAPEFWVAHNNLGWLRASAPEAQFRNASQAKQHAQAMIDMRNEPTRESLFLSSAAHAEAGEIKKAQALIHEALKARPQFHQGSYLPVIQHIMTKQAPYHSAPNATTLEEMLTHG